MRILGQRLPLGTKARILHQQTRPYMGITETYHEWEFSHDEDIHWLDYLHGVVGP